MKPIDMDNDQEAEEETTLFEALAGDAPKADEADGDDTLESIVAGLGDLIGDLGDLPAGGNELIGEGEEL